MAGWAVKSKDFIMGLHVKAVRNSKSGYVAQLVSQVRLHNGRAEQEMKRFFVLQMGHRMLN